MENRPLYWRAFLMEELRETGHSLMIKNRRNGNLTGIQDVLSFDANEILLKTSQGMLAIKGKELHVSRLQLELGEVDVEGSFDSFVYSQGVDKKQKKEAFMKRLLK